ncbi:MAG TPA: ABC transporter ATP-binding protein [Thermodesulfobacteriota bacterium]|nr:ABC transporter ATP-binding protein [Thermodesulfobacteriota bacterium]
MAVALECDGLTKRFGGLEAIKDVTLKIQEGERRAIIGPNGAGKTTLFRLISGEFSPTAGRIRLFGKDVTGLKAHERTQLGLGRTFQITSLFPTLTVTENLLLAQMGLQKTKYAMLKPLGLHRDLYARAGEMLDKMGLSDKRGETVKYLSHGDQRQIEIAMALIGNPRVLLLDEPAAGLSPAESRLITKLIVELDPRITILVIEHDMDIAFEISGSITVLNFGKIFAEGVQSEIRNNPGVQEIYLGAE